MKLTFTVLPWVSTIIHKIYDFIISLCLVLHPQHKLEYFRQAGWTLEWIDTAELLVWDEYECSYMSAASSDSEDESNDSDKSNDSDTEQEKVSSNDPFVTFLVLIGNHRNQRTSSIIFLPSRSLPSPRFCLTSFDCTSAPPRRWLIYHFAGGMKGGKHSLNSTIWPSTTSLSQVLPKCILI